MEREKGMKSQTSRSRLFINKIDFKSDGSPEEIMKNLGHGTSFSQNIDAVELSVTSWKKLIFYEN